MRKWLFRIFLVVGPALLLFFAYRRLLPVYRVSYHSELVMLGDFNGDHRWDSGDQDLLQNLLANPFSHTALECKKADVNGNGRLDPEDLVILDQLFTQADPYTAEAKAIETGKPFPRPRELYYYITSVRLDVEQWQLFREAVVHSCAFFLREGAPNLGFLENGHRKNL